MKKEIPKEPDPLIMLARSRAEKQSRRYALWVAGGVAILVVILGLAFWLTRPAPALGRQIVIAFDQVAPPGESVTLRAVLRPLETGSAAANLGGHDLFFADTRLATQPGGGPDRLLQQKATSDSSGQASVRWQFPLAPRPLLFEVRYLGSQKGDNALDKARMYTWPADTRVLLVEVRYGLLKDSAADIGRANIYKLEPAAEAPETLKKVQARDYHFVYLAAAPDRPEDYHKLRGWLQRHSFKEGTLFPDGPVLGRPDYADSDVAEARRAVVHALKGRYPGKIIAVAGRTEDARGFQEEGLTTYLVGSAGDTPRDVKRVKSWKELLRHLP